MLFQVILSEHSSDFSTFYKVVELRDELDRDYTFLFDYDSCFFSLSDIKKAIADKLDDDPETIELEEV